MVLLNRQSFKLAKRLKVAVIADDGIGKEVMPHL